MLEVVAEGGDDDGEALDVGHGGEEARGEAEAVDRLGGGGVRMGRG